MSKLEELECMLKRCIYELGLYIHDPNLSVYDKLVEILKYISETDFNEYVWEYTLDVPSNSTNEIAVTSFILRDSKDKEIYHDILYLRIIIFKMLFNMDRESFIKLFDYIVSQNYCNNRYCTELTTLLLPYSAIIIKYLSSTDRCNNSYVTFSSCCGDTDSILNKINLLFDVCYFNMHKEFVIDGENLNDIDIEAYARVSYGRLYMDVSDYKMDMRDPVDNSDYLNALKRKGVNFQLIKVNYTESHIEDGDSIIHYKDISFENAVNYEDYEDDEFPYITVIKRENHMHDMTFNAMYLNDHNRYNEISSFKIELI